MARSLAWRRLGAEFVVIVVGVLVALAVDQWRDGLSDRELGAFYLSALERDLRADSSGLEADAERARLVQRSAAQLDSALAGLRVLTDSGTLSLALGHNVIDPPYSTGTILDLTSSGNSHLIEDAELRGRLLDYSSYTERSMTWLAELRRGTGVDEFPTALIMSPYFEDYVLRSRTLYATSFRDPMAIVESLRRDSVEVREWLRRKELSAALVESLIVIILRRQTIPLLVRVQGARAGEPSVAR